MSKIQTPTPTLDKHRDLAAEHPMLGNMFAKSAANRVLMNREQQALDDAEAAKVDRAAERAIADKPHHKKLAELEARSSMLATIYAQNHRFELDQEASEINPPEPPIPPMAA